MIFSFAWAISKRNYCNRVSVLYGKYSSCSGWQIHAAHAVGSPCMQRCQKSEGFIWQTVYKTCGTSCSKQQLLSNFIATCKAVCTTYLQSFSLSCKVIKINK